MYSGSGGESSGKRYDNIKNNFTLYILYNTSIGNELYTSQPVVSWPVVYGTTVALLVALAVVTLVITIIYHKRQGRSRVYYTFAKTITILQRQCSTRG